MRFDPHLLRPWIPGMIRGIQFALALVSAALFRQSILAVWERDDDLSAWDVRAAVSSSSALGQAEHSRIGERNLFRSLSPPEPSPEPEPIGDPVEPTSLRLRLIGTVASAAGQFSMGVIKDMASDAVDIVQVGDSLSEGVATVVGIEQRRVVIDREGKLEAVQLEYEVLAVGSTLPEQLFRRSTSWRPESFR